jgi:hypothetical protein
MSVSDAVADYLTAWDRHASARQRAESVAGTVWAVVEVNA